MTAQRPRVVIDTNVWISGLLTRAGIPAELTRRAIRAAQPVFTEQTFGELKALLWRPKFDRFISLEQRKALLHGLESVGLWLDVSPSIAEQAFCRDPSDDKFIHAALAAESAWLVTGDHDLLVLVERLLPFGVRVLSPAAALNLPAF